MKKQILFFFFFFIAVRSNAATFTVISNADVGAGTLREAITLANANGVISKDYIYFNITATEILDVTIALNSELPILTSNIIIDGTTQPISFLSNPNIKISLIKAVNTFFNALRLDNAKGVEIYGLKFSNFQSDPQAAIEDKKAGIYLYNSADIIIGAPNKPNCFVGNYAGILSPFVIPRFDIDNIKISSNIFGLSENGLTTNANEVAIDISFLTNSIIGGDTPAEGNLVTANTRNGIAIGGANGAIKITNNIIGLNKNFTSVFPSIKANGVYVNGEGATPLIKNNIICGQLKGILLDYANGGFIIAGNKIGTGPLGTENFANEIGIHVNFCNKGMIGGNVVTDGNSIAFNKTGVLIEIAYPISMLKNSFYCNSTAAVTFKNIPEGKTITQSKITQINANSVSGSYLPNSTIELFYTDSCPDCQGKTWFATVSTDASGNWIYNGPITGKVTSMGTNQDGATSTFSKPIIDNSSASIVGVICGASTGSIEVDVYDSSVFAWYNINNPTVVVSTERKLINAGAGTYFLKAGQNGLCDPPQSQSFTIDANANGINDQQMSSNSTYCGSKTGFIKGITIANDPPRIWYNANGVEVGYEKDLINQPPGNYYFKTGVGPCTVTSKIYTIPNIVITYKIKEIKIVNATCGSNNGSITISSYENELPTVFTWYDSQNNEYAKTENLTNLAPGKYKLVVSGINGCSNDLGEYTISAVELPVIDYSALQKYISCDGKSVSTTGIKINGSTEPYTTNWMDENGNSVSTKLNLNNVGPGRYTLFIIDKNGCLVNGQTLDFEALQATTLNIPNSLTPNGDGINDFWEIKGSQNYPEADFSIFNRNGNRVFYSRGYGKPFNGIYNGKILPVGVYFYVIDLKIGCGKVSGSLTILR